MKKNPLVIYLAGIFMLLGSLFAADTIDAQLEPEIVVPGEPFYLILNSAGNDIPELQEVPEGFQVSGRSQSVQINNNQRHNQVSLLMLPPDTPGKYTIGPLKVKLGRRTLLTKSMTLTVQKDTASEEIGEQCFLRSRFSKMRGNFYVGENIPLEISLFYRPGLNIAPGYPALEIGKSVFADYRQQNPRNKDFAVPRQNRAVVDNVVYGKIIFNTAVRPLAPGKLQISGIVPCQIRVPVKSRSNSFFGSTHYREIQRKLKVELPEISVLPLPELPGNEPFTKLIGQYQMICTLDKERINALEPLSLQIVISGQGGFESFSAPVLQLNSCRVYPGQVNRQNDSLTLEYIIIPLKSGVLPIDLKWLYFDPEAGRYQSLTFADKVTVDPPLNGAALPSSEPGGQSGHGLDDESEPAPDASTVKPSALLYCKKAPESAWSQFYRRNRLILAGVLVLAGAILLLSVELIRYYRQLRRKDPDWQRRRQANARRSLLAEKLRTVQDEELPRLVTGEIADCLCDLWGLPAGSTPEEVAAHTCNFEVAEVIQECANISYLPSKLSGKALNDAARTRRVLLNVLKCVVIGVAVLMGTPLTAAEKTDHHIPQDWTRALQAFDHGDYPSAGKYFEQYDRENPTDCHVLYNLGCIAEAENKPELALFFFEAAGRLNPSDRATIENRNLMRRKLLLDNHTSDNTPVGWLKSCRDWYRWEDYCFAAALGFFIFCVIMALRKRMSQAWRWALTAVIAAWMVIVLAALLSLTASARSNDAMVVVKQADLYNFPNPDNTEPSGSLSGGSEVRILEKRSNTSLVRSGNTEGWILNENIRKYPR